MRASRRLRIFFVVATALSPGLLTASVAHAATFCPDVTVSAGAVSAFTLYDCGGSADANNPWGNYATIPYDNAIESLKIGGSKAGSDGRTYDTRFMACTEVSFGGTCRALSTGNIPYVPQSVTNMFNRISSYRVQRYATTNRYPSALLHYDNIYPSGVDTRTCTWGAAYLLGQSFGIYPGWHGNAAHWDDNARTDAYWKVDQVPDVNSFIIYNPGTNVHIAKNWSSTTNSPTYEVSTWPGTWTDSSGVTHYGESSQGHVGWVVDFRQEADGTLWIHSQETNIESYSHFHTFKPDGQTLFFDVYVRWSVASDKDGIYFIHAIG